MLFAFQTFFLGDSDLGESGYSVQGLCWADAELVNPGSCVVGVLSSAC